jgi:hypothetical protein
MQDLFGSEALDIGVGLSLLFLFISLICAAVREVLEGLYKSRALQLHRVMGEILDDRSHAGSGLAGQARDSLLVRPPPPPPAGVDRGRTAPAAPGLIEQLYNHPAVYALYEGGYPRRRSGWWWRRLPSYIPASNFSGALLGIIVHGDPAAETINPSLPITVKAVQDNIATLNSLRVRRVVLGAFDFAPDLASGRKNLEDWYNSAMDRVSGWYKRETQLILFGLGLAAAVLLNIDAITIAQRLGENKELRTAVAADAQFGKRLLPDQGATSSQPATAPPARPGPIDDVALRRQLESLGSVVGWEEWRPPTTAGGQPPRPHFYPRPQARLAACAGADPPPAAPACSAKAERFFERVEPSGKAQMVLGWLVTAFAVTLGAPFWFDVLNRFMVVRSTVKPHEKSQEEASKDAASKPAPGQQDLPPAEPPGP